MRVARLGGKSGGPTAPGTEEFELKQAVCDLFDELALFFREKGHRLPDGYVVNAIHRTKLDALARQSTDNKEFLSFITTELIEYSERHAWGQVFGYSWVQSPNDEEQTWWLLDFFGSAEYLCNAWTGAAIEPPSLLI